MRASTSFNVAFAALCGLATWASSASSAAIERAAADAKVGYAFFYFRGDSAGQEEVFAAVSKGNSPLSWDLINGGNVFLSSNQGTTGVRDPSIVASPDGSKFYMLGTDLKVSATTWSASARTGSRSILIWESTDLVNWGQPALREVVGPTAGNAWAPEAIWNPSSQLYEVFFSSAIYPASDPKHETGTYQRVMKTTTKDFVSFTPAVPYIDDGKNAYIDTTFLRAGSKLYRFTKDENSVSSSDPNGKMVFQDVSSDDSPDGKFTRVANAIGKGSISQGEGPTAFVDNNDPNKSWLFIDEFGGRGYVPFYSTDVASGKWQIASDWSMPSNKARHGTVLPVDQKRYDALRKLVRA
ncbi:uncharacterized protein PFL1_02333 [Pseudozyma flocculosa PF-1]|uniref:Related to carbon source-regulated protein (Putative arabinase) n=1 Tax=Pseudozyma flocculosa TaxID=84751 RepID=A0A5C3F5S5_9BASI|nr:uncharacterized protein PFL1_02333 [Pseudozyma flocculosa PF-1]EPQ30217.1 hypothetical protein PFL1_02333 [Pseudozyma flocculosa PF-1]SPO39853.1 related to carbon source-regulated protein (putative arabinase) [Pseudozyma flocculosa]